MVHSSRAFGSKVPVYAAVAAFTALTAGSGLDEKSGHRSVTVHCAAAEKIDKSPTKNTFGLELPELSWARRIHDYDQEYAEQGKLPVEQAILTTAPNVPPPIKRRHPALVKVDMTTELKMIQLTSRYKYEAWTFNKQCPGPMIRARVGDVIELSLTNNDPTGNPHNIDCHGFEGPGGGAGLTLAQEKETKVARFKLLYPGLYVYHCAAAPVPVHVANGMYGLMLLEPENTTLPTVEKEFYVMQSEFTLSRLNCWRTASTVMLWRCHIRKDFRRTQTLSCSTDASLPLPETLP
jgi:FtsP/CotA-like multicopper oxidase with cupredoxin domain